MCGVGNVTLWGGAFSSSGNRRVPDYEDVRASRWGSDEPLSFTRTHAMEPSATVASKSLNNN